MWVYARVRLSEPMPERYIGICNLYSYSFGVNLRSQQSRIVLVCLTPRIENALLNVSPTHGP